MAALFKRIIQLSKSTSRLSKSTSRINAYDFFSSISSRRMSGSGLVKPYENGGVRELVKPYDDGGVRGLVKPYDDGGVRGLVKPYEGGGVLFDRTDLGRHLEAQGIQGKHVPIINRVLNRIPNVYVVDKDIYFHSLYRYVNVKRDFVFGDPKRTTMERYEDAVVELIPHVVVFASFLVFLGVLYRVKN